MNIKIIITLLVITIIIYFAYTHKNLNDKCQDLKDKCQNLNDKCAMKDINYEKYNIYDDYIVIDGYIPTNIKNKNTFTWDHVDTLMDNKTQNFIWSGHVFGAYVNSFDDNEDFTLTELPRCTTYIRKRWEPETFSKFDDKVKNILGIKKSEPKELVTEPVSEPVSESVEPSKETSKSDIIASTIPGVLKPDIYETIEDDGDKDTN